MTCKKCLVDKSEDYFSLRTDNSRKVPKHFHKYCKECESILCKEAWERRRNDEYYIEKKKARAKKWYLKNREAELDKAAKRRATEEWKMYSRGYMTIYNELNRNDIRQKNLIRHRRYIKRIVSQIDDAYIVKLLSHPLVGYKTEDVWNDKDLIIKTKVRVATHRIKRLLKRIDNEK